MVDVLGESFCIVLSLSQVEVDNRWRNVAPSSQRVKPQWFLVENTRLLHQIFPQPVTVGASLLVLQKCSFPPFRAIGAADKSSQPE
jgi:hypothetical protein